MSHQLVIAVANSVNCREGYVREDMLIRNQALNAFREGSTTRWSSEIAERNTPIVPNISKEMMR